MQWKLSEEQDSYRETLRAWLADVAPSAAVRTWGEERDEEAFAARLVRDGWWGVGVPEDHGGQGGGVVELALTAEELGRAAAPSSGWLATVLAAVALPHFPDHRVAWLLPSDAPPGSAVVDVRPEDGSATVTVPGVLDGAKAAVYVLPVGRKGERRLVSVDRLCDGVTVRPRALLDRSRSVADVVLDAAPTQELVVDAEPALARAAATAGVLVAADALGAMERMLELAVDYSRQRRQFGVPIGSFQAVKHAAATIKVAVEAGRSAVYFAAASVDADLPDSLLHAAAVKAQVTASAALAADTALTMHGAIGYTWEHDLHLYYKRARLDEFLWGAPTQWNELVADGLVLV
jgi:alkylation response protein AidB-like acyl-CoA dehydrogenase